MADVYSCNGITPVIDPAAFVHPSAVLIGDVVIAAKCYIGPCAVLRGDFGRVLINTGANVQETCVLHSFPNQHVVVEADGHIGHGAILHGCHIGKNVMIGMNSVVMDKAVVGENSIVGALCFIKSGQQIPPASMVFGSPAKVVREVTQDEIDWKKKGTAVYQLLAEKGGWNLERTEPLTSPEPNRPTYVMPDYATKE